MSSHQSDDDEFKEIDMRPFEDEEFEVVGERPFYVKGQLLPKFHLNDGNIYVSVPGGTDRGPFKIAKVDVTSTSIMYKLSHVNDDSLVDDGILFDEIRLIQRN